MRLEGSGILAAAALTAAGHNVAIADQLDSARGPLGVREDASNQVALSDMLRSLIYNVSICCRC